MTDQEYEAREIQIIKYIEAIEAEYKKAIEPHITMLLNLRATQPTPFFITVEQAKEMGLIKLAKKVNKIIEPD
jgi:hypothetical protein